MINLTPKEEKKKMAVDFYCRLAILLLLMGSFTALVALLAILPAYFMSSVKNSIAETKLETQKQSPLPALGEQSLTEVKGINNQLSLVENAEKNKFLVSERIVNAILLKKTPGIKITQIVYQKNEAQGKKVSLTGIASSRESLLLFEQALEADSAFQNVDLPISSFVKESNLQFNLTLTPS